MHMHPIRKRRLLLIVFFVVILGIVASLVLYALKENINLFFFPTQILEGQVKKGSTIRLGGKVVTGSIIRFDDLTVQFKLTDLKNFITVNYKGILPDLFREEQGIIATGKLDQNNDFQATTILAKHDANYIPKEVQSILTMSTSASHDS